jgi:hypothetical protein
MGAAHLSLSTAGMLHLVQGTKFVLISESEESNGSGQAEGAAIMSLGTILVIILIIFLLGGFSGRFGGYGYGYGNRGVGGIGAILLILVILVLLGKI